MDGRLRDARPAALAGGGRAAVHFMNWPAQVLGPASSLIGVRHLDEHSPFLQISPVPPVATEIVVVIVARSKISGNS